MALIDTDLFILERGGVLYKMTASQIKTFVRANYIAANIAARDALVLDVGDEVYVIDASADPTVTSGGAKYIWDGTAFLKIAEDESFDVTIAPTNLSYTPSPTNGLLTSSTGTDATIPVVNSTNAGLATPAMLANSHVAATAALTASTNPITVSGGQAIGFSISQLAALP